MSDHECFTEMSLALSYRQERPELFRSICKMYEQCLKMRGLILPQRRVDANFMLDKLGVKKFGAVCFSSHHMHPLSFVWGDVNLYKDTIILSVSHFIKAGSSAVDQSRQHFRNQEMKRLLLAFAQAHYSVYSLEPNPQTSRPKIYISYGSGGNKYMELLGK